MRKKEPALHQCTVFLSTLSAMNNKTEASPMYDIFLTCYKKCQGKIPLSVSLPHNFNIYVTPFHSRGKKRGEER